MSGQHGGEGRRTYTKDKVIATIFMSLFASAVMGLNLFIPLVITSIMQHHHPTYTKNQLEGLASTYKSFMDGTNAIIGLLMLPLLGSVSDVIGRKQLMGIGVCALMSYMVVIKLSYTYSSITLLYAASAFSFYLVTQISTIAFMSDISLDEKDKAKNFGLVLAGFMFGFIFGSLTIGYLGKYGINVALYSLFGLCIFTLLFLLVAFKEDNPHYHSRHERTYSFSRGNPFTSMRLILSMNPFVTTMVMIYALNFIAISDGMTSGVIYTMHRYGWGSLQNGIAFAVSGSTSLLWQGLGVGLLLRRFTRERVLTVAMFFTVSVHVLQGYAPHGWVYLGAVVIGGVSAIAIPLMQSLISERIPKDQQGIAFGGLSAISSSATFVGALFSENVLSWCLSDNFPTCPGTAFFICGFLFVVIGTICVILFHKYPPKKDGSVKAIIVNSEEEVLLASTPR